MIVDVDVDSPPLNDRSISDVVTKYLSLSYGKTPIGGGTAENKKVPSRCKCECNANWIFAADLGYRDMGYHSQQKEDNRKRTFRSTPYWKGIDVDGGGFFLCV